MIHVTFELIEERQFVRTVTLSAESLNEILDQFDSYLDTTFNQFKAQQQPQEDDVKEKKRHMKVKFLKFWFNGADD